MMLRLAALAEALSEWTGRAIAWLTLAMVLVGTAVVVMRYLLEIGSIPLQESVTWMHAAVFLLGAAYTLKHDEHVRVDIIYRRMGARGQAWVDLTGTLFFLLPLCVFLAWNSWDYVALSWELNERSREANGLPGLYLLKSLLPLTAVLLAVQATANALRAWARIREA